MIFVLSVAIAAESTGYAGTFVLPEARERAAGEVTAALGTGLGLYMATEMCLQVKGGSGCGGPYFDVILAPVARVAWSPTPGTHLEAYGGATLNGYGTAIFDASASFPVSEVSRLGVFAGAFSEWYADGPVDGAYAIGVNYSAQWQRVRFDAVLPVVGGGLVEPMPSPAAPAVVEASFSFDLGKGHALRAGMMSLLPGGGWQYAGDKLVARVDLHSLGVISAGRAEVGARF